MNIVIWVIQLGLAVVFLLAGATKAFQPMVELNAQVPWTVGTPGWVPRLAGYSELAGALGLVLPSVLRIRPGLTPLAAAGLGLVMVLAAIFHLMRGEMQMIPVNLVLLVVSGFVYYGRSKLHPIQPR